MSTRRRIGLAALALVLLGTAGWWLVEGTSAPRAGATAPDAPKAESPSPAAGLLEGERKGALARSQDDDGPSTRARSEAPASPCTVHLHGRVLSGDGDPPLDAVVYAIPSASWGKADPRITVRGTTDRGGNFDLAFPWERGAGFNLVVGCTAPGRRAEEVRMSAGCPGGDSQVERIPDFVLSKADEIRGVVVGTDGLAKPQFAFLLWWDSDPVFVSSDPADPRQDPARWREQGRAPWVVTDATGHFRVFRTHPTRPEAVSLDPAWVFDDPPQSWSGRPGAPGGPPGPELRLVARPALALELRAVDAKTGAEVDEGLVAYVARRGMEPLLRGGGALEHGRLVLSCAWPEEGRADAEVELVCEADGRAAHHEVVSLQRGEGRKKVVLRLPPASAPDASRRVAVRDPEVVRMALSQSVEIRRLVRVGDTDLEILLNGMSASADGLALSLPAGTHRLLLNGDGPFADLAPWRLEVRVPLEGDAEVKVTRPRVGTLRVLHPALQEGQSMSALLGLEPSGGEASPTSVHSVTLTGGGSVFLAPEGDWTLVPYREVSAGIMEHGRYPVHIDVDRETRVELGKD